MTNCPPIRTNMPLPTAFTALSAGTSSRAPIQLPMLTYEDNRTPEQIRHDEFANFQTDAAMTAINAMLSITRELAQKVVSTITLSAKSEWRGKYQILHDYTRERDMLTAVHSVQKELQRNATIHNGIYQKMCTYTAAASSSLKEFGGDFSEQYLERIDTCDEVFAPYYERIRCALTDMLRPVKCSDPKMFYLVMQAIYMAARFKALRGYIRNFATGLRKGEVFTPIMYFNIKKPLMTIAHRCNFRDKQGRELILLLDSDEVEAHNKLASKKSWQKQHPDGTYQVLNIYRDVFDTDRMMRLAWELETKMMEIETIDHIILKSEGHDPLYRDDYPYKHVQSCVTTFEQAMLNSAIALNRWSELPRRLRDFADSCSRRKYIDPRRRPRPVAGFTLKPVLDKQGRPVKLPDSDEYDYTAVFIGIWNSISEASAEWGVPISKISDSIKGRAINDGKNNVWISFEDYVRSVHLSMSKAYPVYASELVTLFPEYSLQ